MDYSIGFRVQRVGWQLEAQGTVIDKKPVSMGDGNVRLLLLVRWDYRGIENDITTIWADEVAPVINWHLS